MAINRGPLLGYHIEGWGNIVDDGPVDRSWAKSRLDACIAKNRAGPCDVEQSVFGLFREGDLNAFEPYILSKAEAEIVWDFKFGPPRFLIFERVSYNRRTIKDFSTIYLMLDLYCDNRFDALKDLLHRLPEPSDFRSSFKS